MYHVEYLSILSKEIQIKVFCSEGVEKVVLSIRCSVLQSRSIDPIASDSLLSVERENKRTSGLLSRGIHLPPDPESSVSLRSTAGCSDILLSFFLFGRNMKSYC